MPAARQIMLGLHTLVAREVDPHEPAVVSVGACRRASANNVIPQTAQMKLSVRALDAGVRDLLQERITALVRAQAAAYGCAADIDYQLGYPVLVNTRSRPPSPPMSREDARRATRRPRQAGRSWAAKTSRSCSRACPGSYAGSATASAKGGCMVHNPGYDFNDDILAIGASYWVASRSVSGRASPACNSARHGAIAARRAEPAESTSWRHTRWIIPSHRKPQATTRSAHRARRPPTGQAHASCESDCRDHARQRLEFYDFTIYSFFATIIGKLFFPVEGQLAQLMLAVGEHSASVSSCGRWAAW